MRKSWTPIYEEFGGKRVCKIPLTQGFFALIDAKYLSEVQRYSWYVWCYGTEIYACTMTFWPDGRRRLLKLHQLIWKLTGNVEGLLDHKNNDGLDCRRRNLRPGPKSLNGANRCKQLKKATSSYKGIYWCSPRGRWCAQLRVRDTVAT